MKKALKAEAGEGLSREDQNFSGKFSSIANINRHIIKSARVKTYRKNSPKCDILNFCPFSICSLSASLSFLHELRIPL